MSEDRPIVNPQPHRNADGTTTVTTLDAGDIRLVCPAWCTVQHGYRVPPAKAEIVHRSGPQWALTAPTAFGEVGVGPVQIVQQPYASTRTQVLVAVVTDTEEFHVGPADARRFASAFRELADLIDQTAGQAEAIRAGEDQ
ncbi:hypothetical protein K388_01907 [Streptomyces sp. KhCrAH-43]|uniref:DUF6907 domain-containing protein n=1 Tax=unclassified Streptomyces TaxID=2593676 RepID=UPI0003789365|nr:MULTISPECIES: hypothetical protein [unclassified Streptomyces]MYS34909.1 hypothetical protein [Streptomyces sp. SID4920]MYX65314.1 hypothetical protein [Streptomyces sp. SID8373]RAJ64712.1 hypothetical protein K388_01907 [Streptomyces sp. KhCrAH-43]